jgi:hypothetical protein
MRLTVPLYASARGEWVPDDDLLTFDERLPLQRSEQFVSEQWPAARTSPLLIQIGPQTYRFLNREVFGFLVAMANAKGLAGQCPNYARDMFRQDIVGIVNRYYYTWLENDARRP